MHIVWLDKKVIVFDGTILAFLRIADPGIKRFSSPTAKLQPKRLCLFQSNGVVYDTVFEFNQCERYH